MSKAKARRQRSKSRDVLLLSLQLRKALTLRVVTLEIMSRKGASLLLK
jgi:hypothetical protein